MAKNKGNNKRQQGTIATVAYGKQEAIKAEREGIETQEEGIKKHNEDIEKGKTTIKLIERNIKRSTELLTLHNAMFDYFEDDKDAFCTVSQSAIKYKYQIEPTFVDLARKLELHGLETKRLVAQNAIDENEKLLKTTLDWIEANKESIKVAETKIEDCKNHLKGLGEKV